MSRTGKMRYPSFGWQGFFALLLLVIGSVIWLWLTPMPPEVKWHAAQSKVETVHRVLGRYAEAHDGKFPNDLNELVPEYLEDWALENPYSQTQFLYERTPTGYVLRCNGADDSIGGDEIPDLDIVYDETGQR